MESLLQLIKALLKLFSNKKEKVLVPKRLTEEGKEVETNTPEPEWITLGGEKQEYAPKNVKYIWCDGERYPIEWDKVVTYREEPKWSLPKQNMKLQFSDRDVKQFMIHWDGCLDSEMCHRVLLGRGLSVHFCIDNDGTIIQLMDTNNIAWHARGVNNTSVGVEVSNAVYMKHAKKYKPRRPVWENVECHGKQIGPILGFTNEQVKALKVLTKTICKRYNIPLQLPRNDKGELYTGVAGAWKSFNGVMGHYHINSNKTDPAGLDLEEIIKDEED